MEKRCFNRKRIFLLPFVMLLIFLLPIIYAHSPTLKIFEKVEADYDRDGTMDGTLTNQGYLKVYLADNDDVLQYVRINVTGNITKTNISAHTDRDGKAWNFYRGAASNATSLYREGDSDTYSLALGRPLLNLSMTVSNYAGGLDVYSNDNIVDRNDDPNYNASYNKMKFLIYVTNPSTWRTLEDVFVNITFQEDTGPGGNNRDLVNVTAAITNGTPATGTIIDADGGTDDSEMVGWKGDIAASTTLLITVNATILTDVNWDSNDLFNNLNTGNSDKGVFANLTNISNSNLGQNILLSNLTIQVRFSRGPVRQGVDMLQDSSNNWRIRGLFKNIANNLDYTVGNWSLYQVNVNGSPMDTPNSTALPTWGNVAQDTTKYTTWFNTGVSSKPYYASYFDWNVTWTNAGDGYDVKVIGTMDMEDLYFIDITSSKSSGSSILLPNTSVADGEDPQAITITDTIDYKGNANSRGLNFSIYSVVPSNGTSADGSDGGYHNLDINCSSVIVRIYNATNTIYIPITQNVTITCVNSTAPTTDGYVFINVTNLSYTNYSQYLWNGDDIVISYNVLSNESVAAGTSFNFTGNITVVTASGTPLTEALQTTTVTAAEKILSAYKELKSPDSSKPSEINVSIKVEATDKSSAGAGIADIKIMDYVANGTNFSAGAVTVTLYNGTESFTLVNGTNITVNYTGVINLPDGTPVFAYEYSRNSTIPTFWNGTLYDGQWITIEYLFNITKSGTYSLPMMVVALDPATGKEISASAFGIMHIELPEPAVPLEMEEGEFTIAKSVIVGKPAMWVKTFTVYNPNPRAIKAKFETTVFKDAIRAYASYYDELGEKMEEGVEKDGDKIFWETSIGALETRTYDIVVMTSPILEIDRKVDVLEKVEDKRVKLKMDIYLKSFAKEDYFNIILNLPIGYEQVQEVRDAFGNKLAFSGGAESISIKIDEIEAEGVKTVTIIYLESYPAIIVTPSKERYNADSPVGLSILVINGGETIEHPYFETEVYDPHMSSVYSTLTSSSPLEPLEKTELTEEFFIPLSAPTGAYIANVRFREDFSTISQGVGNFYVVGKRMANLRIIEVFVIVILGIGLLLLSYRRAKEIKKR